MFCYLKSGAEEWINQRFNISRLLSLVERSRLKTFADHEEHELRMNVIQIEHGAKYM